MTLAPTPIHRGHAPRRVLFLLAAIVVLLAALVVLLARHDWGSTSSSSAVQGSGIAATQTRSLASFTTVDLTGANNVTVHVGGKQAVVVRADDNLIGLITTEVRAGRLAIGTSGSLSAESPMSVDISVPTLRAVAITGSGVVSVDGIRGAHFTVQLPGSGLLRASGGIDRLDARLSGSGDLQLQNLVAHHATALVTGSGRLEVNATKTLDASVTGSGAIFYTGNPRTVTKSVTGAGVIAGQ